MLKKYYGVSSNHETCFPINPMTQVSVGLVPPSTAETFDVKYLLQITVL